MNHLIEIANYHKKNGNILFDFKIYHFIIEYDFKYKTIFDNLSIIINITLNH
jgi:hypothetical protein